MGEATYYFKATFKTEEQAKKGFKEIKKYLVMNDKAADCLKLLQKKFRKLSQIMNATDGNNALAGKLISMSDVHTLEQDKLDVLFSATVWHFDDWDHLVLFAKSLEGCKKAAYISRLNNLENQDYFDMVY